MVHLLRTLEHSRIIQPDQVTNIYRSVHTRVKPGQPWCCEPFTDLWQPSDTCQAMVLAESCYTHTHTHKHKHTHTHVRRWRYQGVLAKLISSAKVCIRRSAAFKRGYCPKVDNSLTWLPCIPCPLTHSYCHHAPHHTPLVIRISSLIFFLSVSCCSASWCYTRGS